MQKPNKALFPENIILTQTIFFPFILRTCAKHVTQYVRESFKINEFEQTSFFLSLYLIEVQN